jgi:hypothetical protein
MNEGSCVGLDVHARSVVAGVIDMGSGEVRLQRVPPGPEATVAWLKTLPAPTAAVQRDRVSPRWRYPARRVVRARGRAEADRQRDSETTDP